MLTKTKKKTKKCLITIVLIFYKTIFSHLHSLNGNEPVSTLTQDFHTRLDNLLRSLVHARPHFVRCIQANSTETPDKFDRAVVMRQIRSLQVLETVNLMAGGNRRRALYTDNVIVTNGCFVVVVIQVILIGCVIKPSICGTKCWRRSANFCGPTTGRPRIVV